MSKAKQNERTAEAEKIRQKFLELVDLPAESHADHLEQIASENPAIADALQGLLTAHASEEKFLENTATECFSSLCQEVIDSSNDADIAAEVQDKESHKTAKGFEKEVGHFRLLRLLHSGSQGELYVAFDNKLKRLVALRVVNKQREKSLDDLLEANSLAAKVRSPNVATVLGVFQFGELTAIAREWIPGKDLGSWATNESKLTISSLARISLLVSEGIKAMHDTGVIHGDIKPGNIIINPGTQQVALVDFGTTTPSSQWSESSGKKVGPDNSDFSSGHFGRHPLITFRGGTPLFMAPELFDGKSPTFHSDLFSLGVVLFWLSTRKYPYPASDLGEMLAVLHKGERCSLHSVRPDLPETFCCLVDRLLEPNALDRPKSIEEVILILAQWTPAMGFVTKRIVSPSSGRRRWFGEAILWGISIAFGAGLAFGKTRFDRQKLLNDVPPFLPASNDAYFFSAKDESDACLSDLDGVAFGDFRYPTVGSKRICYPARKNRWGWVELKPMVPNKDANYALLSLGIWLSRQTDYGVDCEVYVRNSLNKPYMFVSKKKFKLFMWDVSKYWKNGEQIQFKIGMRYTGAKITPDIPPIGLNTINPEVSTFPRVAENSSGSLVGWQCAE